MPTKLTLAALTIAATALAGCQDDKADPAQPATGRAASSASAATGIAVLSADEIMQQARATLTAAKSFRVKGNVRQGGQQTRIDVKVSRTGFISSMSIGKAEVKLISVDGKKYLRANEQFWIVATDARQGKALARGIGDRWVAGADTDQSFANLFAIGSADRLFKPEGALSKGEEKQIGGVPAIALKDAGDPGTTFYVATTGEPYPLQMTGTDGSVMKFSDFGASFTDLEAPTAGKVVDLGQLTGD
ncbi:hypothetical protein [Actinoplanes sp. NPDC049316]|uniref:hypothetical protein n=1 Tax=Actinoplanes sp. NPDC049316 TaxID=3154727 RepID=UPI00342D9BDD